MIFISWAFAAINHRAVSNLLSHRTPGPSAGPETLSQCPRGCLPGNPRFRLPVMDAWAERWRRLPPSIGEDSHSFIHTFGKQLLSICCFLLCTGLGAGHTGMNQPSLVPVLGSPNHGTFSIALLPLSRRDSILGAGWRWEFISTFFVLPPPPPAHPSLPRWLNKIPKSSDDISQLCSRTSLLSSGGGKEPLLYQHQPVSGPFGW